MNNVNRKKIEESLGKVEQWVEEHDYKGYEPFDGLSSFLRPLTFGNLFLDRLLMQLIRQSPVNLRPLFGVKSLESTIGRGYMAGGYITMLQLTGDTRYRDKAALCLDWLIENKSPQYADYSWGKHFDFASRGGRYPTFEPITIWTSLIGFSFLDAYETFNEKKYLDVVVSVCNWILSLPKTKTDSGLCINYTALNNGDCTIHNQSMNAAALLARTVKYTNNKDYVKLAQEAMKYSCTRQLPDGSWYYGENAMNHWIDNFHTGYNLDSLKCYIDNSGDRSYEENLRRGFEYYINHFFEENGRPKYYHNRAYPIDSQCISQAIETLANFSGYYPSALPLALKVTDWTIENMQDKKGYFYYRQYPGRIKAKTPMLHWAQATTYKALSLLLSKLPSTT
jgi:rhamnogalacturonyl hydrolase YesR